MPRTGVSRITDRAVAVSFAGLREASLGDNSPMRVRIVCRGRLGSQDSICKGLSVACQKYRAASNEKATYPSRRRGEELVHG